MTCEFGRRVALALRARAQQHRAHAGRHAHAVGVYIAGDELHRVVDREACRHRAAGAVDVDVDVLVRILHLQVEQLGDDVIRQRIADRLADEDDAILHQPRQQVELDQ
jgi:hypothetical protein